MKFIEQIDGESRIPWYRAAHPHRSRRRRVNLCDVAAELRRQPFE